MTKVETSRGYDECRNAIIETLKSFKSLGVQLSEEQQNTIKNEKIEEAATKIAIEIGIKADQIKAVLKEYFAEDLKEFQELYKILADKMRPMVYELGFLK